MDNNTNTIEGMECEAERWACNAVTAFERGDEKAGQYATNVAMSWVRKAQALKAKANES